MKLAHFENVRGFRQRFGKSDFSNLQKMIGDFSGIFGCESFGTFLQFIRSVDP